MYGDNACNRWYFQFNGNEWSGPMPIESVLYTDWVNIGEIPDNHCHHYFASYCENIPRGTVIVQLWVGKCRSVTSSDEIK